MKGVHTIIQKKYKKQFNNLYKEFIIFLLSFEDELGNKTLRHDKTIEGSLWKEKGPHDIGNHGQIEYYDIDEKRDVVLVKV